MSISPTNPSNPSPDPGVRPAAVAGTFYPGVAGQLSRQVVEFLENAGHSTVTPGFPKALIVPHAGYIYSGAVAASAYDLLRPARGIIKKVVLLGPCHRVAVRGLALPGARAFNTPLGWVPVDQDAVTAVRAMPQVVESAAAHAQEHSLEVQLPFLQIVLGEFSLLPLAVGRATPQEVAEVIERVWGGPETLIVISSDLSHFHPYAHARAIDAATVQAILAGDTRISHEQACGATPIAGMLVAARNHGLAPRLLDCRNSGDTAGGRDQVVGYASFSFSAGDSRFGPGHGRQALAFTRETIGGALGLNAAPQIPNHSWLREHRASFVTLTLEGQLRGCIGSLLPHRPLAEDIMHNARASAFQDPRFAPLTRGEFERIGVEVSLLSLPKRMQFSDHADLVSKLQPGIDGVIVEHGNRRSTFLPQVWEQLQDAEAFLAHLKAKAGLAPQFPSEQCVIKRYSVLKWRDTELTL